MSKRVHLFDMKGDDDDDDRDLRSLLEKFLKKSEELEKRESKVLKQVELVQSAVASLQAWKGGGKPPTPPSPPDPPHIDVKTIEAETQEIREEMERIQREVQQKIEDNRRLKEEIERRNAALTGQEDEAARRMDRKQIESRAPKAGGYPKLTYDPGIDFFNKKLYKLQELEKKMKKEMEEGSEEARRRKKTLTEKIDLLERETHAGWHLGGSHQKKTASSK